MRNIWTIYKKELNSYFVSWVAYLLLAMFAAVSGFFFWVFLRGFIEYGMMAQMRGQMTPMNVNEMIIRPMLSNLNVIGLFFIPIITMRLFAEEKRNGTIELLATSPITDGQIIIGKWLAALTLYAAMLVFTGINLAFLFKYGNPDWRPLLVGYLGMLLFAGAMLAIGIFISSLTKNQIIAGAITFGICLLLWVIGWAGQFDSGTGSRVLSYISVTTHFESFEKGVLASKDAIYYVTLIFLGLFLTTRSMESLRWRS
jgi:ABC-2 type transport system permease protein